MGGKSTFPVNHGRQTGDTATGSLVMPLNIPGIIYVQGRGHGRSPALELVGPEGCDGLPAQNLPKPRTLMLLFLITEGTT